jgi:ribosomal protein L7/L12
MAGFDASKKLTLIKEIRTLMGLGLKEVFNY